MKHRAIYPGTFDPITNGHLDIITRAAKIFPQIVVAVAANRSKSPFFPLNERILMIEEALEVLNISGIRVLGFDGLLMNFVREQQAGIVLRGLRAVNDFEYEFQLAAMNRKLSAEVETLFLTPSDHLMFISSTLVREIATLHGDVSQFVPESVNSRIKKLL